MVWQVTHPSAPRAAEFVKRNLVPVAEIQERVPLQANQRPARDLNDARQTGVLILGGGQRHHDIPCGELRNRGGLVVEDNCILVSRVTLREGKFGEPPNTPPHNKRDD